MEQLTITKTKNNKIYVYGIHFYPFIDYDFIVDKLTDLDLEYVSFGYGFCRITSDLDIYDKLKIYFGDNIQEFYPTSFKYSYIINFKTYQHTYTYINNYKILQNNYTDYEYITNILIKENLSNVKFGYKYLRIYTNEDIRKKLYEYFGECISVSYDDSTFKFTIIIDLEKIKN